MNELTPKKEADLLELSRLGAINIPGNPRVTKIINRGIKALVPALATTRTKRRTVYRTRVVHVPRPELDLEGTGLEQLAERRELLKANRRLERKIKARTCKPLMDCTLPKGITVHDLVSNEDWIRMVTGTDV